MSCHQASRACESCANDRTIGTDDRGMIIDLAFVMRDLAVFGVDLDTGVVGTSEVATIVEVNYCASWKQEDQE